ncbi:hypothetical protein BGW41_001876 [Actinomortierella wolfii]|nr:hypothetical protein BGW41_001876 [Actinomortierella wolfii]
MVNPRVFFDIDVEGQRIGRIVMELFANECPVTVENFRALCTGERGMSKISNVPLHYRGSIFHRVIKGFMIQGGDFTRRDGTGGESIYGQPLQDESFKRKHDIEGLLSMANKGPNTSSSQFFITTRPTPHLDGKHVVFGRVVKGYDVVEKIEVMPTDERDRPLSIIMISNCGELVLRVPPKMLEQKKTQAEAEKQKDDKRRRGSSSSSSESSSSESEGDSRSSSSTESSDSDSGSESDSDRDRRSRHKKKRSSRSKSGSRSRSRSRSSRHKKSSRDRHSHRSNRRHRSRDSPERSSKRSRRSSRSRSPSDRRSRSGHRDERDESRARESSRHTYRKEDSGDRYDSKTSRGTEDTSSREPKLPRVEDLPESDLRHSLNAARRSRSRSRSPEIKYKGRGRMKYRERRAW